MIIIEKKTIDETGACNSCKLGVKRENNTLAYPYTTIYEVGFQKSKDSSFGISIFLCEDCLKDLQNQLNNMK